MKRFVNRLLKTLKLAKVFSFCYGLYFFFDKFSFIEKRKNKFIQNFILNKYGNLLKREQADNHEVVFPSKIWLMWWQGTDSLPDVVDLCYASLKKNATEYEICFLTKDNFEKYISIPADIKRKIVEGLIPFAVISDYVRMKILAEYGGIWLDARVFLNSKLTIDKTKPFWTIKRKRNQDEIKCFSDEKWIIGLIGGCKQNQLFVNMVDVLEEYWCEYDIPIDYFFTDAIIMAMYKCNPSIEKMIDSIEESNNGIYFLTQKMNAEEPLKDCLNGNEGDFYILDRHCLLSKNSNSVYHQLKRMVS